jgi:hypothetical protein
MNGLETHSSMESVFVSQNVFSHDAFTFHKEFINLQIVLSTPLVTILFQYIQQYQLTSTNRVALTPCTPLPTVSFKSRRH